MEEGALVVITPHLPLWSSVSPHYVGKLFGLHVLVIQSFSPLFAKAFCVVIFV